MWRGVKSGIANTVAVTRSGSFAMAGRSQSPDNISIVAPAALLGCRCFSGRCACRIIIFLFFFDTVKQIVPNKK